MYFGFSGVWRLCNCSLKNSVRKICLEGGGKGRTPTLKFLSEISDLDTYQKASLTHPSLGQQAIYRHDFRSIRFKFTPPGNVSPVFKALFRKTRKFSHLAFPPPHSLKIEFTLNTVSTKSLNLSLANDAPFLGDQRIFDIFEKMSNGVDEGCL